MIQIKHKLLGRGSMRTSQNKTCIIGIMRFPNFITGWLTNPYHKGREVNEKYNWHSFKSHSLEYSALRGVEAACLIQGGRGTVSVQQGPLLPPHRRHHWSGASSRLQRLVIAQVLINSFIFYRYSDKVTSNTFFMSNYCNSWFMN